MSEKKEENNSESETNENSKLNSFHQDIFKQIDKGMMSRGISEVLKSIGASPFQQSLTQYINITSGNSLSHLLNNVSRTIPTAMNALMHEISGYNKMINQNVLSHMGSVNDIMASIPISALSNLSSMQTQLLSSVPKLSEIYSNSLRNVMEVQNTLIEKGVLSSLSETVNDLTKNLNYNLISTISELVKTNKSYLSDAFSQSYLIQGDSLIIEEEKYTIEELQSIIGEIVDESGISTLEGDVNKSLSELNKSILEIKDNKLKTFLIIIITSILIPILLIVYTPKIQEITNGLFNQYNKSAIKKITIIFNELNFDNKQLLKDYRIVSAKVLNVREQPKQRSKLLGSVFFGQLVPVKKTKKDWTFIQIITEEKSDTLEGWVFSRYLKRFK